MTTYWLKVSPDGTQLSRSSVGAATWGDEVSLKKAMGDSPEDRQERLVEWTTEVLLHLIRKVVARRNAICDRDGVWHKQPYTTALSYEEYVSERSTADHVADVIQFAPLEEGLEEEDPSKVVLDPIVETQLRSYVSECAALYNDVAFHNFEHASRTCTVLALPYTQRENQMLTLSNFVSICRRCHVSKQTSRSNPIA